MLCNYVLFLLEHRESCESKCSTAVRHELDELDLITLSLHSLRKCRGESVLLESPSLDCLHRYSDLHRH